ncbi:MAG: protein-disulfide reductase DsbD, partial [Methylotenera sp.]
MLKTFYRFFFILLLAITATTSHAGASSSLTDSLFNRKQADEEFLSPDLAFNLEMVRKQHEIVADFKVAPGYYLYKKRIQFALTPAAQHSLTLPDGDIKDDPNFGEMEVYHHDFTAMIIILVFVTAGLLLAFTPCVFPMIPILSSIIIGKNAHVSRLHAFNLSLAYTMGMCLTYTLAGIAAGLSGQMLSSALQTPWALSFGALVFAVLALSMFGFYELKLPSSMENGLMNLSRRIKGGKFFSDFLMGALSALIISPCVAAPLAGALLYISKSHDVVLGGVALFSLSLGMGTPLLLIGASAGTLLPKVGSWMNAVRNLFGVLMLAMALWLITPIIPVSLQLALWAALLIVPAIFMHALDPLPIDTKPALRFWKGIALMMLMTGLAMLIGALSGAKSPLQPLAGLKTVASVNAEHSNLNFQKVRSLADLEAALQNAQGKTVMLDFYADWCVSCKELE